MMMKNVIVFFSMTNRPKIMIFGSQSISIRLVSPWPLVEPIIFITTDMQQQNQFLLNEKR